MRIKKALLRTAAAALCISLFIPLASFAMTRDDIINALSCVVWSDSTIKKLDSTFKVEVAQQYETNKMTGTTRGNYVEVGNYDVLYFPPGLYCGSENETTVKGSEQAFRNSYCFLTMPELKIGGAQYFVAIKYDSNSIKTPDEQEKNTIIDALKKVKEGMAANPTEANLKSLVSKYVTAFTFNRYNYGYIADKSINGSVGWTTADKTMSKEYRFLQTNDDYIIAGPKATTGGGSLYDASILTKKTFTVPCVAIKNDAYAVGGKSYWIVCDYTTKASEASSDIEIDDALQELSAIIEEESSEDETGDVTDEDFPDEDTPGIDIGDPDEDSSGPEIIEDETFDSGLSSDFVTVRSFNKDPLSYIDDFSFADTNSTDEKELKAISSSYYNLILTFSIIGLALSIIAGAIKLMLGGYKAKNDVLNALLAKAGIFALISGFAGFIGAIIVIIESFV